MVCKKYQVYDWFRTLDGAKRIDFLNGMLHLCFPLELRFLGSCIEELARKDYSYLRDAEIRANTSYEIQLMRDIADKVTRSKMIVTLALLASHNHECARLIYDLLNVDIMDLLEKMKMSLDEKVADEFLLLLTMAANHPAFDFQMKTNMSQLCLNAENKLKQNKIIIKETESDLCLCSSSTPDDSASASATKSITTPLNNKLDELDNVTLSAASAGINKPATEINNNLLNKTNQEEANDATQLSISDEKDTDTLANDVGLQPLGSKEPIIESIDFEGVQTIPGTDNYKFSIKIHWSDKGFNKIEKTYSEFCEFNKQLVNLFPKELDGLIEKSQLVIKENQKEDVVKELPLVSNYCSQIAGLPKIVCESLFLRSFFRSNLSTSSITIANESNSPNRLGLMNTSQTSSHTNSASQPQSPTSAVTISASNATPLKATSDMKMPNKSANAEPNTVGVDQTTTTATATTTTTLLEKNVDDPRNSNKTETKKKSQQHQLSTTSISTKAKVDRAVISVAHVLNSNQSQNDLNSINKSNSSLVSTNQQHLPSNYPVHNQSSFNTNNNNNNNINNNNNSNSNNNNNNSRPGSANSSASSQMFSYQQHPIAPYHPSHFNSIQHQQQQQQHFLNMNQSLHLQTFQPLQNLLISSPPCPSPSSMSCSAPSSSTTTVPPNMTMNGPVSVNTCSTTSNVPNTHSLNNSRSNSPWNMPPPPLPMPMPPQQQAILNNSNNVQFNTQYTPNYQHPNNNANHFRSNSNNRSNFKDSKNQHQQQQQLQQQQHYNTHYPMINSHDDLLLRCALDNSSAHLNLLPVHMMMPPSADENYLLFNENLIGKQQQNTNNININNNNRSSASKSSNDSLKKNNSKPKESSQQTNDSLLTAANSHQTNEPTQNNGTVSPKLISNTNKNNSSVRSSSSCSSTYQTPPPLPPPPPPTSSSSSSQPTFPISVSMPLHLQQQQQQKQLISPSQQVAALAAYNAMANFQQQAITAIGHPYAHSSIQQSNTHLLPLTNAQMLSIQQQQQQQHSNSNHSLLLAPLIQPGSISYAPLPPQTQNQQPQSVKHQLKHQSTRFYSSTAERSHSPATSNVTSDEENNNNNEKSKLNSSDTRRSSSINSGQRMHRKVSTSSTSSTNAAPTNNNINNHTNSNSGGSTHNTSNNKYQFSRQHNSHSISSTTTTIKPTSSNTSSNSSLNTRVAGGSSSSLSVSPSALNQVLSPITNNSINSNNKSNSKSKEQPSPKSLKQQQKKPISPLNHTDNEKLTNELNQESIKEKINNGGQYSTSSSSSSISTVTLMNNNINSTSSTAKSPPVQPNNSNNNNNTNMIQIGSHTANAQLHSSSNSINQNGGQFYYSPVVSPYTYIDGSNIYALTNGLSTNLPPSVGHHSHHPHHHPHHSFNPYHTVQPPPPPPPPPPNSAHHQPSLHHHHQSNQANYIMHQQQQHQQQQQTYHYNLIPMVPPPPLPPPLNHSSQTQSSAPSAGGFQQQSVNCATPTPGSSPNPTVSSSSSSSSTNLNTQPTSGGTNTVLTAQPAYSIEQQIINPYSFNMMSLANVVANNQANVPGISPNMVMMMMIQQQQQQQQHNQQSLPPSLPSQLMTTNNKYNNYQHYNQPYRSHTPNSLIQQPSPSNQINNTGSSSSSSRSNSNQQPHSQNVNKKKVSCYNCGLMTHTPRECDQPSLESISHPNQYRLNFKSNSQPHSNGSTSNSSTSHLNLLPSSLPASAPLPQIATPVSQQQPENSDEIIQASKTLNSPSGYSTKNGITGTTPTASIQSSTSSSSSSSSLSITLANQKKSTLNPPSVVNMTLSPSSAVAK